jgi:hypothetical protein
MSEVCPGCGRPVTDDDSIIRTPAPAQVVWHAKCHDRCARSMKRQKIRAWRPGEREALERSGFTVVRAENRGGMWMGVDPAQPGTDRTVELPVGAQVELDDAEDLARTMPEAFGR